MDIPEESPAAAKEGRLYSWEQIVVGLVMAAIVAITFANVIVRYFTAQSLAATEELSIALLPVLAFLGSVPAFLNDRHIRVTFFVERLPRRWRILAERLDALVTVALYLFLTWYAARLTYDQFRFEETSPALGIPQWWYTIWLPLLSFVIAVRLALARFGRRP
jgi:TRAP-type C4-dicarboxylate transport system permease small subunit